MNYYEELGVSPTATPEEIRKAYYRLCKLLHPDQQMDAELRSAAECQMRRLNSIHETLADPERRRLYDGQLAGNTHPPPLGLPPPVRRQTPDRWSLAARGAWFAAAAAGVAVISWWVSGERLRQVQYPPEPAPFTTPVVGPRAARPKSVRAQPGRAAEESRRLAKLENQVRQWRIEQQAAAHPLLLPLPPLIPAPSPLQPAAEPASLEPEAPAVSTPPAPRFAGTWYWAAPSRQRLAGLYPPEYIEAVIVEREGRLRGRYRARYRVADRAISPNVAFQFEGRAEEREAQLPWQGPGGAQGEVHLRLLPDARLEVNWSAGDLGEELGLAAGTAILVRRP